MHTSLFGSLHHLSLPENLLLPLLLHLVQISLSSSLEHIRLALFDEEGVVDLNLILILLHFDLLVLLLFSLKDLF